MDAELKSKLEWLDQLYRDACELKDRALREQFEAEFEDLIWEHWPQISAALKEGAANGIEREN